MPVLFRAIRGVRLAARQAGLVADPTRRAARAVERLLATRGRDRFLETGVPGLAVVVRFADGPTLARCYGTAGAAGEMRPDTVFQALSLSKSATVMCALALVERSVLSLDEPVWRRITSWRLPPERAAGFDVDGITLRRLLSHGAGFGPLEPGYCDGDSRPTPLDLLRRDDVEAQTMRLVAPPGRTHRYAASGFVVAQLLIEEATGRPFPALVRELVLEPLGMRSSAFELTPALAPRLATRHDEQNRPLPPAPLKTVAASGMYTTAEDLATILSAVVPGPAGEPAGRGVVSPASCAEMLSTQTVTPGEATCGLGFYLRRKRADLRYSHAGRYGGWYGHVEGLVRRRVVFVLLSNGDRGLACVEPFARDLRGLLYDVAL